VAEPQKPDRGPSLIRDTSSLPQGLLEQYSLAVEMADRVSARRATANGFFLTVQTVLVALLSVPDIHRKWIAGAGVVFAATWWLLLRSYRDLNTAKWNSIQELEKRLPAQPFTDEWKTLKEDRVPGWRARYAELGFVERIVPTVFGLIFAATLIWG
jgi:hypothetical protein